VSWICPKCGLNNVNYNKLCANWKCKAVGQPQGFDEFDKILQRQFDRAMGWDYMSDLPTYKDLFNSFCENPKVLGMNNLELRAHREKLMAISFQARAEIDGAKHLLDTTEFDENTKKRRARKNGDLHKKEIGFERSVNEDTTGTNAIAKIKERQARMSKTEKLQEGLKKLFMDSGMSEADAKAEAERRMTAGHILERVKGAAEKILDKQEPNAPIQSSNVVSRESLLAHLMKGKK